MSLSTSRTKRKPIFYDETVNPRPAQTTPNGQIGSSPTNIDSDDDSDLPVVGRLKRPANKTAIVLSSGEESDGSAVKLATPRRSGRKQKMDSGSSHTFHQRRPAISPRFNSRSFLSGGTSGYAPVPSLQKQNLVNARKSNEAKLSARRTRSSDIGKTVPETRNYSKSRRQPLREETSIDYGSNQETDESIAELQIPRRRGNRKATTKKIHYWSSEEDSDVILTSPRKAGGNRVSTSATEIGDDFEDDIIISSRKRNRPPRPVEDSPLGYISSSGKQAQHDLEEDMEALQETDVRQSRTRVRVGTSEKSKALDRLKRSRAGEQVVDLGSESGEPVRRKRGLYDSASPAGYESSAAIEVSEGEGETSGTEAIRQAVFADTDAYDEDFVDDDGEDLLGVPDALAEIPLEYTRHAHKKPLEHFKDAVEWMVHNKLNPAFSRNDPVYRIAFIKLNDEVRGYASSKFVSAAWTGDFAIAIKARPQYYELQVPAMLEHKCDACNRSNHPATYQISFKGKAYHHDSLEAVSDDEDEDKDDDESEVGSHNSVGNIIPTQERQFFVGRFCRHNAQFAHALLHWRYHLNDWILGWLEQEGYTTADKVVEREKWSIKKRGDFANKVVDGMEEKGEVKALYRDFKNNLEAARDSKPPRFGNR